VSHFDRFVFRRQLRQFPGIVSLFATSFQISRANRTLGSPPLANLHFTSVGCFGQSVSLQQLPPFQNAALVSAVVRRN
jgi:hypothetical protein